MDSFKGTLISKLPNVGTSIFAVMSKYANDFNAINLSQGFPDFEIAPELISLVHKKMNQGLNQYAPMPGTPELRKQIVSMFRNKYQADYDVENEINITAGATQAIYTAISAFIRDEDEVIIFEPAYDSYGPSVRLNGGMVKYAQLIAPDYHIDWTSVTRMISNRTKMIIINTPHNPTGSMLSKEDMEKLQNITRNTDIIVLSDEVYEHLVFDGNTHYSAAMFPDLASRSIVVGSFGKTFHATGWKCGFALAPANLMAEFRKAHQFVVYAVNTPVQLAIAEYMENPENYLNLGQFFTERRNFFLNLVKDSRFKALPSSGTYFQLLDYSDISDMDEFDFAMKLIKEYGVAAIPVSAFYQKKTENKVLRFCIAKNDDTLTKAAEILCKI
jgi:methionine aminotransferase